MVVALAWLQGCTTEASSPMAGSSRETLPDGTIVVRYGDLPVDDAPAEGERPVFDLFTRDGEYEGSIRLGFQASQYLPIRIRNGQVYALTLDSLDIPTVVRGSMPPAGTP